MRRRFLLAALFVLMVACGATSTSSSIESSAATTLAADQPVTSLTDAGTSGSVDDACALLSREDLGVAAGGSWGEPRLVPGVETIECDFVEDSTRTKFFVAVYREGAVTAAGGPKELLASLAYPAGSEGSEVEVGDKAAFFEFPHVNNRVVMIVDGAVIEMSGETSFGVAFDQESMAAIAAIVAQNL